jgi:DNA processing protein
MDQILSCGLPATVRSCHRRSTPQHADELCRASGLPIAEVSATLVMLELKGLVRQLAPMTYARAR